MRNFIASPRSAVLLDIVLSRFYKLPVRSCSSQQPLSVLTRAVKLFGELSVHLRVSNISNISNRSLKTWFYAGQFSVDRSPRIGSVSQFQPAITQTGNRLDPLLYSFVSRTNCAFNKMTPKCHFISAIILACVKQLICLYV